MFGRALQHFGLGEQWQRTLWIMFLAQVFTAIGFSMIFPFLPLYVEELGTNTGLSLEFWAGMVFSSQALTMMLISPFWGALADRYGRKLMVQRAMFGGTVIIALMAFVSTAEGLTVLRAIQGLITGTVAAANALVAASAPRHRTGFAMGLVQVALWLGISLGPLIGGIMADAFGFRVPFLVTAALLAFGGVLVTLGLKEPEQATPRSDETRESAGLLSQWKRIVRMPGVAQTYVIRFMVGLSRTMLIPIMPLFVATLMTGGDSTFVPDPFTSVGVALVGVSTVTGIVAGSRSAAATFSAVFLGRLGDRVGHRRIVVVCALAAAAFYFPAAFVVNPWQLLFLTLLSGLATGGLVAAPSALLAQYTDPGEEGAVYGLDNSMMSGSRAVAPLAGSTVAAWFGLRATFIGTAGLSILVLVVALILLPNDRVARARVAAQQEAESQSQSQEEELTPQPAD